MLRLLIPALVLTATLACSGGGGNDRAEPRPAISPASETPTEPEASACAYQLHDDLSGESSFLDAFPSVLEPTAVFESGDDLLVTVDDPDDAGRDLTLIVPACKRTEAEPFLEGLSP